MKTITTMTLLLAALAVTACGAPDSGEEPGGIIPEHQLEALDKAKGTEQILLDAEEKRRQQMEDSGI